MAQNDFLQFDENNENVLTQDAYREDEQRISGAKSGVARSSLFNKVMRQASTFVAGFGQFISEKNINVLEDINSVKNALTNLFTAKNIGVSTEVQELLGANNVDDGLKELSPSILIKMYWWKRRTSKDGYAGRETYIGAISIVKNASYTVGTGYEIDVSGKFILIGESVTSGSNTINLSRPFYVKVTDTELYKITDFSSSESSKWNYSGYSVTVEQTKIYGETEYVYSKNKEEYPNEDGTEQNGYIYDKYLGQPLAKAILLDDSVEADELALIIQNTYELELLKLGIEV